MPCKRYSIDRRRYVCVVLRLNSRDNLGNRLTSSVIGVKEPETREQYHCDQSDTGNNDNCNPAACGYRGNKPFYTCSYTFACGNNAFHSKLNGLNRHLCRNLCRRCCFLRCIPRCLRRLLSGLLRGFGGFYNHPLGCLNGSCRRIDRA